MAPDAAFERHLQWLLDGRPVTAESGHPETPSKAMRIVDAIARAHRTALFGTEESPDVTVTRRWGHLEIRDEIGRGVSGTVYRAWDTRLAREVALKLWSSDAGHDAALEEGRLLARLDHPNIVRVYGADIHDGIVGIWMELLEGESLEDILDRDGVFSVDETLLIGRDLAGALAAVHAAGLMHRDIKARNVVRERGGRIVLMDLGAGLDVERTVDSDPTGTPLYMAPEVLFGGKATERADLYGLGVLLHHVLARSYPVQAGDLAALQDAHRLGGRARLQTDRPDVPADAAAIVERLAEPDPGLRWTTATEVEAELGAVLRQRVARQLYATSLLGRLAARRGLAVALVLVGATVVLAGAAEWNSPTGRAARRQFGLAVPPRSTAYLSMHGAVAILRGTEGRAIPHNPGSALALAVTSTHGVRTMAGVPPWQAGAAFRLDGAQVAPPTASPLPGCCFQDGTSDGRYNYAVRRDSTLVEPIGSRPLAPPALYRFGLHWNAPEIHFRLAPGGDYVGVAYSRLSRTFWLTRRIREGAAIEEWSADGRHLRTPVRLTAAALTGIGADPLDGTLWVVRPQGVLGMTHLENYTPDGQLLGTLRVQLPPLVPEGAGLEFAWIDPAQ